MELSIILTTLLNAFATSPDLCAEVYADAAGNPYTDAVGQTLSRHCRWTGPDAPILDSEVCCVVDGDTAACSPPDSSSGCSLGSKMYCEYGEQTEVGTVCYQPLSSICDYGFCQPVYPPSRGPVEDVVCCWGDACIEVENLNDFVGCHDAGGYVGFCINGAQNVDGTVDCFD